MSETTRKPSESGSQTLPEALPIGTIIHRKIRGKDRFYHQWRENGKTRSRYLKADEVAPLRALIDQRKRLALKGTDPSRAWGTVPSSPVERLMAQALTGKRLLEFAVGAVRFKKRFAFNDILRFLRGQPPEESNGILMLNGPTGAGKTTLIRQLLAEFSPEERERTVYLHPLDSDTEEDIACALAAFQARGIRSAFIDDTPFASDFGLAGLRIVLTANLPLPALYAGDAPLIDRLPVIDLGFVPYAEHNHLFGETDPGDYLMGGGSLSRRGQSPLTMRGLSLPIDRTLGGMEKRLNDRFLLEVLTSAAAKPRDSRRRRESFVGNDLGRLARQLGEELGDGGEQEASLREVLLTVPPGVRHRHLEERILTLLNDPIAAHLGAAERKIVRDAILTEARERLFEDLLWHELSVFRTSETAFVERIRFAPGAYGFVIADREELTCELVTARLTDVRDERQLRYISDIQHLERIEHRYGIITAREIVYLGRNARHASGVQYRSARDYLTNLAERSDEMSGSDAG